MMYSVPAYTTQQIGVDYVLLFRLRGLSFIFYEAPSTTATRNIVYE